MKKLLDLKLEQELGILNFEKGFKFCPVTIFAVCCTHIY